MGRNINNLRNVLDTSLMTESKEELKNLLMRVQEESEKAGLKLNIKKKNKKQKKTRIVTSSSIISWQIEGEKVEAVTDFFLLALKSLRMTASMKLEDDCFLAGKL